MVRYRCSTCGYEIKIAVELSRGPLPTHTCPTCKIAMKKEENDGHSPVMGYVVTNMTTYDLKLTKRGRGGWKEHIPETEGKAEFFKKLNAILDKCDSESHGSYRAILKGNGGYGKNHETGFTSDVSWKGPLKDLGKIFKIPRSVENDS